MLKCISSNSQFKSIPHLPTLLFYPAHSRKCSCVATDINRNLLPSPCVTLRCGPVSGPDDFGGISSAVVVVGGGVRRSPQVAAAWRPAELRIPHTHTSTGLLPHTSAERSTAGNLITARRKPRVRPEGCMVASNNIIMLTGLGLKIK